ncbi:MAG: TonB-dependent receptor [Gemmatimonadota bacterium]
MATTISPSHFETLLTALGRYRTAVRTRAAPAYGCHHRRQPPRVRALTLRLAVSLIVLPITSLSAQTVRGDLTGRAIAEDGEPLSGVRVTVAGSSLQGTRQGLTDQSGFFRTLDLPIGVYTAEFTHIGYRPVVYEEVRIHLGRVTTLGEIRFEPAAVELPALRVVSAAPAIDPVSTTIGFGLDASHFDALPIGRRDYQSIINILPHANESFLGDGVTVGGSTGLENAYFIDGANVTDPIFGRRGTRLPWNFIQSVRIRNGGYGAEYGKALGGIVDAVTYSGGNEFEASLFGFFTGSGLADAPRAGLNDLRADAFHTSDVGLRLGGTIVRDHVWYSAAYNPRVESIHREIPGHGVYEDRETIHAFAAKINWHPAPNTDFELSVFGDPSFHNAVGQVLGSLTAPSQLENPGPLLSGSKSGGTTASLRFRQQLGPHVILLADLSSHWARYSVGPDVASETPLELFRDLLTNTWSGGPGLAETSPARRTVAGGSATVLLGPHTAKFGVEYEASRSDYESNLSLLERRESALYEQSLQSTAAPHDNRIPAVYLQDSWRIDPRLVLNAGVRWSRQRLIGDGGAGVQTFPNQWQPRLGLVYQPGRIGTQRLSASYGRYYQQLPVYFSQLFYAPYSLQIIWFSEDPRPGGVQADSSFSPPLDAAAGVDGIQVEHFDEFSGGYERDLGKDYVVGARVVHRVLRAAFGYGVDPSFATVIGNFGEGGLGFLPKASRTYSALEVTLRRGGEHRLQGFASYVLSRTHGNYTGLFGSDQGVVAPNNTPSNKFEEQGPNSTGLLPNDRAHVLKLSGSYRFPFELSAGTFFTVQSGTPLNEFGASFHCSFCPVFLVQRGSAGRSSTLWDLNFSFAYPLSIGARSGGRVFLDVLHVGSPRASAWEDQVRFLSQNEDGDQINPNPNFGGTLAFQPPMSARLGFELGLGPARGARRSGD